MKLVVITVFLALAVMAQRKPGSQLDHLPSNMQVLTYFGERADISPDNRRIAFMAKSFGDAMVIDLDTRRIRCLTCNVPAAAFLRVDRNGSRTSASAATGITSCGSSARSGDRSRCGWIRR